MFTDLPLATRDLASAITLLLPGFVAVSLFEITNPAIARDRQALQWVMWSLVVSLLLFAAVHGLYALVDWPRSPLDPQFYVGLLLSAILVGYGTGRSAGTERGRHITQQLRILLPPWVWVAVLTQRRWVVVHLTDGTILYGYPQRFTDDPREHTRELYLEEPSILSVSEQGTMYKRLPKPRARSSTPRRFSSSKSCKP
ncbi:MAG: DUF6338 family protein [Dehalococcoidia bacterium]